MNFDFIPHAEASVSTLMNSIDRVIINPLIVFIFACAIAYFLYGIVRYLLSPDNEEVRKNSKSQMIWGILGMVIMVSVFFIMNLILNTFGEKGIKINNTGQITITK